MNDTHAVITTIGDGSILTDLAYNAARYDRKATVWVIADHKTPLECRMKAGEARRMGLDVRYLSPREQDAAMWAFPDFYRRLPWNSDSRRNVGYFLALQEGCERLIIMDDDNYPGDDDFIGSHERVGMSHFGPVVLSGWVYHNYLKNAITEPDYLLYPRGFPLFARERSDYKLAVAGGIIGINLGTWTGEPDIDAAAWLNTPALVSGWMDMPEILSPDTWTPINSQNTCIIRDLIPSAMFVIQRYPDLGFMDRFGDIFAGYFLQACLDKRYLIQIGNPVAIHRRNRHDYMSDLRKEAPAIAMLEWLLPLLREFEGEYPDLAEYLRCLGDDKIPASLPERTGEWLKQTAISMECYHEACLTIEGVAA